jgi:hypothetical protein
MERRKKKAVPAIRVFKLFLDIFRKVRDSDKQQAREKMRKLLQLQTCFFMHFGTESCTGTRGERDMYIPRRQAQERSP